MIKRLYPYIIILLISALTVLTFWGIWNIYFQQDEWNGFGKVIYAQRYGYLTLVRLYGSHFTPFSSLFFALLYNVFGLHALAYSWYSIVLHSINGILVYLLARLMLKDARSALFAAGIFITSMVSSQTITWYAASASYLPTGLLALLGLIAFELFLKKKRRLYLVNSIIFTLLGLSFRENTIFLLGYMPIRAFLISHPAKRLVIITCGLALFTYLALRFLPSILASQNFSETSVSIGNVFNQTIEFIIFSLPQLIIPRNTIINISKFILNRRPDILAYFGYPPNRDLFIEQEFIRILYFFLWICSTIGLIISAFIEKSKRHRTIIISLISFLLLSVLPFTILRPPLYMESRHFYLSTIGFALLISYIFSSFIGHTRRRQSFFVYGTFFIFLLVINIYLVQQKIAELKTVSAQRVAFNNQVTALYQNIPLHVIFYGHGDSLPHQSGTGYTLMVLFHNKQPYFQYLKDDFLWNLGSQDYKENNDAGFGYVTDFVRLQKLYCKNTLTPSEVYSFSWNARNSTLTDTSKETRLQLDCSTQMLELQK